MVKKRADILLNAFNSIKLCFLLFIAFFLNSFGSFSNNTEINSSQQDEITKYCKGEALIVKVFDIPPNSKIDSIHFMSSDSTLKFILPTFFTKEDTLLLFFNSETLNITGDIKISTFVGGTSVAKESHIRIVPKPQITLHPADYYVCQNELVIFSVEANNYDKIRWQHFRPDAVQWNPYGMAEQKELRINAIKLENDKNKFRAELTNEGICTTFSEPGILLIDTIKPEVICPDKIEIIIDKDECSYTFENIPRPEIYDLCGYNAYIPRRSDSKQVNDPYLLGTTSILYEVPDKSGNIGRCRFDIIIKNDATVKIPCKAEEIIYLDQTCRAQIRERPLLVTPPCENNSIQVFYSPPTLNYSQQGNYTLRHYAFHNKVEDCITQVTVLDTFSYKMVYKPEEIITRDTDPGKCTRTILPDPPIINNTCTRNRDYVDLITPWPDNNEFPIGTTEIEWGIFQYNDKVDTIKQSITINDVSEATVNCPPDPHEAYLDPGDCDGWINIPSLSQGGACGPVKITNNITSTDNASGNYPAGLFTINWTVTADNNFMKTCEQSVIVKSVPQAQDDIGRTSQNEPVTITVLTNDTDCQSLDNLVVKLVTNSEPTHGTARVEGQNIIYTPNTGFYGSDSFTYSITNEFQLESQAQVWVTVDEIPQLQCSITSFTDASGFEANDGTATVSITGGIQPWSILWSNGQTSETATTLGAGSYTVVITSSDNQTTTCQVTIGEPDKLTCEIVSFENVTVHGGSDGTAKVFAKGGTPPYEYLWSDGQITDEAIGLMAGTYSVTVTDHNNYGTTCQVVVTEPGKLICRVEPTENISNPGAMDGKAIVLTTGGTPPYSYLWDNGQISQETSGLAAGIHLVAVTDFYGDTTNCQIEMEDPFQPCQFLIPDGFSPNGDGIGDRFYIRCIEEYPNANIQIFNRYGQLLYHKNNYGNTDVWGETDAFWDGRPNKGIKPFNSILPSGTYFYVFNPGNGLNPKTGSIYLNTNREGMR
jgi:gliding motility-associated-like protein